MYDVDIDYGQLRSVMALVLSKVYDCEANGDDERAKYWRTIYNRFDNADPHSVADLGNK